MAGHRSRPTIQAVLGTGIENRSAAPRKRVRPGPARPGDRGYHVRDHASVSACNEPFQTEPVWSLGPVANRFPRMNALGAVTAALVHAAVELWSPIPRRRGRRGAARSRWQSCLPGRACLRADNQLTSALQGFRSRAIGVEDSSGEVPGGVNGPHFRHLPATAAGHFLVEQRRKNCGVGLCSDGTLSHSVPKIPRTSVLPLKKRSANLQPLAPIGIDDGLQTTYQPEQPSKPPAQHSLVHMPRYIRLSSQGSLDVLSRVSGCGGGVIRTSKAGRRPSFLQQRLQPLARSPPNQQKPPSLLTTQLRSGQAPSPDRPAASCLAGRGEARHTTSSMPAKACPKSQARSRVWLTLSVRRCNTTTNHHGTSSQDVAVCHRSK
jgi:hypothetical protein